MSWLSAALGDVGSAIKGVGHEAGSLLSNPLVDAGLSFIPGVGLVGAGLAGAAGGLLKPGGTLGSAATGGLEGAASGAAGGALGGALGVGGASAPTALGAASASAIPDTALGLPAAASSGSGGLLGGLEGIAGKAGDFLGGNGGKTALGIAQGVNAALQQKQSNDYAKQALGSIEGAYAQKAPLRAQGLSTLAASQVGSPYAGRV